MTDTPFNLLTGQARGNWIRLRTLIAVRWVAIIGQITAIVLAQQIFNLQLELGLCILAVGVSITGNLVAIFIFPESKRLSEWENFLMVMFDLLQLSFLLFLTGGLNNPFSVLMLGPIAISASVLTLRSTVVIALAAIILVSVLAFLHFPLRTEQGFILRIPLVFIYGNWFAIVIAILFISLYSRRVVTEIHSMSDALTATQMALSREQKLTDLGGVIAAAAHELGTPLATIKLASAELLDELDDRPELKEDAALIREQADRCRDILQSMGRAGKDDLHLRTAPLITVIEDAAEPHIDRGKELNFDHKSEEMMPGGPLMIYRKPELIHGLRNLIQNAVDFAFSTVWIESRWSDETLTIRIMDDGRGYPPHLIGRIGDPFVRKRKTAKERAERPEYEGMGLGLFIAKTLLERTGAELSFANGSDQIAGELGKARRGAIVEVVWKRDALEARRGATQPITASNPAIQ